MPAHKSGRMLQIQNQLAAADEVNDFKTVVRLDRGLNPAGARKHIKIALDSDTVANNA